MNTRKYTFDIATVLENEVLEPISKKCGCNDDTTIEEWILSIINNPNYEKITINID